MPGAKLAITILIDDCLNTIKDAQMNLASSYWQIPIRKQNQPKTSFVSKLGQYEFLMMPFGLKGVPSTFEMCIETVMRGLQWSTCLVYLDEVIVIANSIKQMVSRLRSVLYFIDLKDPN